jgi:hypothetical protein
VPKVISCECCSVVRLPLRMLSIAGARSPSFARRCAPRQGMTRFFYRLAEPLVRAGATIK